MVTRAQLVQSRPVLQQIAAAHSRRRVTQILKVASKFDLTTILSVIQAILYFEIPISKDTRQRLRRYKRYVVGLPFSLLKRGTKNKLLSTLLSIAICLRPFIKLLFECDSDLSLTEDSSPEESDTADQDLPQEAQESDISDTEILEQVSLATP